MPTVRRSNPGQPRGTWRGLNLRVTHRLERQDRAHLNTRIALT